MSSLYGLYLDIIQIQPPQHIFMVLGRREDHTLHQKVIKLFIYIKDGSVIHYEVDKMSQLQPNSTICAEN